MKEFHYRERYPELLTPETVKALTEIYEEKGKQALFIQRTPGDLRYLQEIAILESMGSSHRMAGFSVVERGLEALLEKRPPRNPVEEEIAGYRDALLDIQNDGKKEVLTAGGIRSIHEKLYRYTEKSQGGKYRTPEDPLPLDDGEVRIPIPGVKGEEVEETLENLCVAFQEAMEGDLFDPLLLISMFIPDFLCIRPFSDGNGRLIRLLTLQLLRDQNHEIGKYMSLARIIEKNRDNGQRALEAATLGWKEDRNNYLPFALYFLSVVKQAYEEF